MSASGTTIRIAGMGNPCRKPICRASAVGEAGQVRRGARQTSGQLSDGSMPLQLRDDVEPEVGDGQHHRK